MASHCANYITEQLPPFLNIVIIDQVLDFRFCVIQPGLAMWLEMAQIVQITLGATMCLLVAVQFIRESLQIYKVTKRFQVNRYMNLLAREGMIYFLAYVHVLTLHILFDPIKLMALCYK